MDVPGIVESALEGEDVAAEVSLGGENALYVTPTRTLIYQSEGFLSDESVDEYPHDAQRMTVKEGRRKTRITLDYSLDGTQEFTVPANATDDVVHPVLAGVLNAGGVTDPDETVTRTFHLDELTLVVTSERLVKHVGSAVWDEDYEEYHFADVTGLDFEDGSVATQLVLEVDGRPERMKVSNERAAEVKEYLQRSLFSYYGVNSLDALNEAVAPEEDEAADQPAAVDFGEGVDPLDAGTTVQPDDANGTVDPEPPASEERAAGGADAAAGETEPSPAEEPRADAGRASGGESTGVQSTTSGAATRTDAGSTGPADETTAAGAATGDAAEPANDAEPPRAAEESQPTATETAESSPTDVATAVDGAATEPADDAGVTDAADTTATDDTATTDDATAADADAEDDVPDSKFEAAGFQPATSAGDEELLERIETLESKVEHQNELLQRQHDLLQQLVDELSRGR